MDRNPLVTEMVVRVEGGSAAEVIEALRRGGQHIEEELLMTPADVAWTIKSNQD